MARTADGWIVEEPMPPLALIAAIVGFATPLLLLIPFLAAHAALDHTVEAQDLDRAESLYRSTAVAALVCLLACVFLAAWTHWSGAVGAIVLAYPISIGLTESARNYGPGGSQLTFAWVLVLLLLGGAGAVFGVMLSNGQRRQSPAAALAAGGAICGGLGLSSLWFLQHFDEEATAAATANDTPGLALAVLLTALVVLVLWRRGRA